MVQVINQDRLHSSAYRTEVSSRQGASSAREALPSPMTGSAPGRPRGQAQGVWRPAALTAAPLFRLHQRRRGLRALPVLGLA